MKVLWVNPWFGNYRVPVYHYLKEFTDNQFYLIYGQHRLSESLRAKLSNELGDHVTPIDNSKRLIIGNEKSDMANACIRIPLPSGIYNAIKRVSPDVIVVDGFFQWTPACLLYSKLHRIPLIIDYERTDHVERNSPWWRTAYRKMIGKLVNGFVVNGSLTVKYLHTLGLENKPIYPGAMSADSYGLKQAVSKVKEEEKKSLKLTLELKDGLNYIFVGQLVERKGVTQLLEAWKSHQDQFPDDNLLVLGEGVLKEELNKYVEQNGLNVYLLGQIPYDSIAPYYAIADVMVMPTLEDNWSLVVPEAMACGLPILCSVYNGCYPELVHNGDNGFTFDPLDKSSFIEALSKIHNCDLGHMGKLSVQIESQFTPDKAAKNILLCCKKVLNSKSVK